MKTIERLDWLAVHSGDWCRYDNSLDRWYFKPGKNYDDLDIVHRHSVETGDPVTLAIIVDMCRDYIESKGLEHQARYTSYPGDRYYIVTIGEDRDDEGRTLAEAWLGAVQSYLRVNAPD